jgi:hypothetical protein
VLWNASAGGLQGWTANAAQGSRARVSAEPGPRGAALRFDFALDGHGAWVIARREAPMALPPHYVGSLLCRGEAPANELQLKLVDPSGANVWWWRSPGFVPPREPKRLLLHRASLDFAWGPQSGGEPDRIGAVELAVAGAGGAGTLWIEDLRIEPRELPVGPPRARAIRASSFRPAHEPALALERGAATCWRPRDDDTHPWLELDLGTCRESGGLSVQFAGGGAAPPTQLLGSLDGASWETLAQDAGGQAGGTWLRSSGAEVRYVRLDLPPGAAVAHAEPVSIERALSPVRWASARARAAPRGRYPRHLLRENAYWAVVGGDGDERKGLLGEDGALEVDAEAFTLEPFLFCEGRLATWADVATRGALADKALPIPSVSWEGAALSLRVTAFASGEPGRSAIVARYTVGNPGDTTREGRLFVAIRPFQVTPAWQALNLVPAIAPIGLLERDGARIRVDARQVVAVTEPDGFGAARSEEGLGALFAGRTAAAERADDPLGFAEGAFAFELRLAPGASESVFVAVPLFAETPPPPAGLERADAAAWGEARLADALAGWRARVGALPIVLPPAAAAIEQSLRASLAWILVNREGPRIQPGPRCYRRSWIRDGTLTGTALAELGFAPEAEAFLRWYAPYQHSDGRVPCAVDRRGVDLAVEHDSHGEFVWGTVELARLTGDFTLLRELWPRVRKAVDAIGALRATRTTDEFRGDPRFGLLPESISHEGYASNPAHSYWDDFFAVRALADAADAARWLGDTADAERIGALRDAMRRDLHTSIALAIEKRGLDFIPGSAELGDFDPSSTAIAFDPCREASRLPRPALESTFERYWKEHEARLRGEHADAYTAYEVRNASALIELGWKERALALLAWLVADQRTTAFRQWPEVSTRDARTPRFLGDLPHGWVASSFVRSVRRLLAYEREADGALVLCAGVPEAWVRDGPGVVLRGLPTHFGPLDLEVQADGADRLRARFGDRCRPPGGFVLESPLGRPLRELRVDGSPRAPDHPRRVHLTTAPGTLVLIA